jgi:hypothetical protein
MKCLPKARCVEGLNITAIFRNKALGKRIDHDVYNLSNELNC